jgi:VWFA-related protein
MRKALAFFLAASTLYAAATAQTPAPRSSDQDDEIVRITTELIQVDAVVADKNDQIVGDLKLEDFELYENGKRQDIKFMEFVSVDSGRRTEGSLATGSIAAIPGGEVARDLSAKDVRRVLAFVVDDVTIPFEDMVRVRDLLSDFVENKMEEGDLVAFVRTVGGKGLLEQFTTDKQILRRAIASLTPRAIPPYLAFTGPEGGRISSVPTPAADAAALAGGGTEAVELGMEFEGPTEGANQVPRAVLAVSVSNQLVDGMRQIPGRKSLILLSGGLPLNDLSQSGAIVGDLTQLFWQLIDNATRSGVVINTMDVRGLTARGAVARFRDTPAKSALGMTATTRGGGSVSIAGGDADPSSLRGPNPSLLGDDQPTAQLGLHALANATGGVSVLNRNDLGPGLEKVLSRSRGYYRLAYTPSEKFDNKFRKLEIKVRRGGLKVYTAGGYYARQQAAGGPRTKEEQVMAAARSPLAKRELDVAAYLQYKFMPENNQAQLDVNVLLNTDKLNFKQSPNGKHQASFDVVGFVFDQLGRSRGGFSQTVNADLSPESYQRAKRAGISYTASTQLPPGYYQVRLVVREAETGNIGSVNRYFEVPDLSNKRLTVSSLFLFAVDAQAGGTGAVETLQASPVISRKKDIRYAVTIHNAKLDNNRPQVRTQLIISQNGKVLFQEPEQPFEPKGATLIKVGQLGLSKVQPGRYLLTLVVTDPLADKKQQRVARSAEFIVE